MYVKLIGAPTQSALMWMKECTVGTMGKKVKTPPTSEWLRMMLVARHSPIRELVFWYEMEIPYWVSNHLVRHHVGFQPYVQSQRNDRQDKYDRNSARQDEPVTVRISINAEALMTLANKRLCMMAAKETRQVVQLMCAEAEAVMPELKGLLVPMCEYHGFVCDEPHGCGKCASRSSIEEKGFESHSGYYKGWNDAVKYLKRKSSDIVSNARCKDCKYAQPIYTVNGDESEDMIYCARNDIQARNGWYCADWERKGCDNDGKTD